MESIVHYVQHLADSWISMAVSVIDQNMSLLHMSFWYKSYFEKEQPENRLSFLTKVFISKGSLPLQ